MSSLIKLAQAYKLTALIGWLVFFMDWHKAVQNKYRWLWGIHLALPILWGCIGAFYNPWLSLIGLLLHLLIIHGWHVKILPWIGCYAIWFAILHYTFPMPKLFGEENKNLPSQILSGEISGYSTEGKDLAFTLQTNTGSFRIHVAHAYFPIWPGTKISLVGKALPYFPPTNPGEWNALQYYRSQNLNGIWRADSILKISDPPFYWHYISICRVSMQKALAKHIPLQEQPLLQAAVLGDMDAISPELMQDFQNSGMLHILAISGQHIGLLALILLLLFNFLRLPLKLAAFIVTLILCAYIPISGSSISVIRSVIMFACFLPCFWWERPSSTLNALGLATSSCLLLMPYQIMSLGFQLSFIATFALLLFGQPILQWVHSKNITHPISIYLLSTPLISLAVFLITLPLLAATIHQVAPYGILGNIATLIISSILIVTGVLTLFFSLLFSPMPGPLGQILCDSLGVTSALCAKALNYSVHYLANLPQGRIFIPTLPLFELIVLSLFCLLLPFSFKKGIGKTWILFFATLFSWDYALHALWNAYQEPASITFLDVGQGDAFYCQMPQSHILIDAGPGHPGNGAGKKVILPFLKSKGINHLNMVLITHPDEDHYGGLVYLLPYISIDTVYTSGLEAESAGWKNLRAKLSEYHIPLKALHCGQSIYHSDNYAMHILSPCAENQFKDRNDNSLVVQLNWRHKKILLTGDIEKISESHFEHLAMNWRENDILKIPHHGSGRTNRLEFIEAIHPQYAILSVGRKNRFGHPGMNIVQGLNAKKIKTFSTAEQGAISYSMNRSRETWETFLPEVKGN